MTTRLNRADLEKALGGNLKVIKGIEDMQSSTSDSEVRIADNVAATAALQDATVITLSSNDALNNERILGVSDGLFIQDTGAQAVLSLLYLIVLNGGYACTFNLEADTNLDFPSEGRVLSDVYLRDGPFADDTAAAAAGVPIDDLYRKTDGTIVWRQV